MCCCPCDGNIDVVREHNGRIVSEVAREDKQFSTAVG